MERSLYINKFRNIGIENSEKIVLNTSLKKGEMGNLVILIGPNNSGKSNILDALKCFNERKFSDRDATTLSYREEDEKISLGLCSKDGNNEYLLNISNYQPPVIKFPNDVEPVTFPILEDKNVFTETFTKLANKSKLISNILSTKIEMFCRKMIPLFENSDTTKSQLETEYKTFLSNTFYRSNNETSRARVLLDTIEQTEPKNQILNDYKKIKLSKNEEQILNDSYEQNYGYKFIPKIIFYQEEKISSSNLKVDKRNILASKFFRNLFDKVDIDINEVKLAYERFDKQNQDKGVLNQLKEKVNKKLSTLTENFNDLYFAEASKYRFEIDFESNTIYFMLFRGDDSIHLDYQSTGFRWFFNLYFNLLSKESFSSGDIIIMDEPATHLHVKGRQELRKFLKEYAKLNDLTFVLATHDPFLIDMDYLDEIRVVSNINNHCYITNDFSTVDLDDPESLRPIKDAFTVANHVLFDPDNTVIFVEGITDYNYLVAFKKVLKINEPIIFLPVKGIGKISSDEFKNKQIEISKRLMAIKKHNPTLLVDSDKTGQAMYNLNKNNSDLKVIMLKEVDERFKQIESLFSNYDAMKCGIRDENYKIHKSSSDSAALKTYIEKYVFEEETRNNFKALFDYLLN